MFNLRLPKVLRPLLLHKPSNWGAFDFAVSFS
jgi:hypothetical protein